MSGKSRSDGVHAINFSWLLRLRWGAVVGQLALIGVASVVLGIDLPLAALLVLVGIEAASNAAVGVWLRTDPDVHPWMLGLVMGLDVALLTAMLLLTGGHFNPFTTLYLVNIALAAVILPAFWTWLLTALSLLCFGLLFVDTSALTGSPGVGHADHMEMHLQGMWVAFGLAATFIVYFVQRVTRALAARELELTAARTLTSRNEKLASLATLAAGAAHQLATPLSTIAVVARELELQLARSDAEAAPAADARLIREQVERCRNILSQLAADAGETAGEALEPTAVDTVLRAAARGLPEASPISFRVGPRASGRPLLAPPRALSQALRGILKNACEASPPGSPVAVQVDLHDGEWAIDVIDRGCGMPEEVLARAGEPFFTTKGHDRGMGLGVFLARSLVESLGGSFRLDGHPGGGTRAIIRIPDRAGTPGSAAGGRARAAA